jgi:hypothetical protein
MLPRYRCSLLAGIDRRIRSTGPQDSFSAVAGPLRKLDRQNAPTWVRSTAGRNHKQPLPIVDVDKSATALLCEPYHIANEQLLAIVRPPIMRDGPFLRAGD